MIFTIRLVELLIWILQIYFAYGVVSHIFICMQAKRLNLLAEGSASYAANGAISLSSFFPHALFFNGNRSLKNNTNFIMTVSSWVIIIIIFTSFVLFRLFNFSRITVVTNDGVSFFSSCRLVCLLILYGCC